MSEFELNLLRQRSLEAIRQKASRGELQFLLPVGPVDMREGVHSRCARRLLGRYS